MIEVFMPKLGPSIEQATVVRWYKVQGESVRHGEHILDIETEKTVQEIEAEADGVLHQIFVQVGQTCAVGTVLALLGAADETLASTAARPSKSSAVNSDTSPALDPKPGINDSPAPIQLLIKASPAARRVARENGVDLSTVTGTGPRGRIVSDDVKRAAESEILSSTRLLSVDAGGRPGEAFRAPAKRCEMPVASVISGRTVKERRTLTSARRAIAERMVQSKQSAPHFYVSMDVDMSRVQQLRTSWKGAGETSVPSYNDFILWSCAQALQEFPELNGSLVGDELHIYADTNIGMATAVADGLLVPVIHHASQMSVRGVACHAKDLVARARDRKLLPADCEGGTFTVSNLGMFGVDNFVAIINPPQCAVLAVGQVAPRVVTDGSSIMIRTLTTLTLSVDHRIADGVLASRFLGAVKVALEQFEESTVK